MPVLRQTGSRDVALLMANNLGCIAEESGDLAGARAWYREALRDVARVLQVIAGHDPHDSTSADAPVPDYLNEDNLARFGGPLEFVIDGRTGFVVPPRPEALGAAMRLAWERDDELEALGRRGLARASELSWDATIGTLLAAAGLEIP